MSHIHWYPGHIAKAERKLKEQLSLVDVVIEVLDARIPHSSIYPDIKRLLGEIPRLIILNKSDLADDVKTKLWIKELKERTGHVVVASSSHKGNDYSVIVNKLIELGKPKMLKLMQKGLLPRPVRVMVVGMPNVGKSSIINKLIKKAKTKTGAKAGVTRMQQWVRVNPRIDLLDTPGIIPLKLDNQLIAQKLAFVNSVSENAYQNEEVANELIQILCQKYKEKFYEYYNLEADKEATLENIALARNWLVSGSAPDITRTAAYILKDFRDGKAGKFTLDDIDE
ncbi:ribosome biogenesis GTPase YlqF [bacterium]|nr:ribosome biogenesis GTPase YlqF [bacterium]